MSAFSSIKVVATSTTRSPKWSLPFTFCHQYFLSTSHLYHVCYMSTLSHPPSHYEALQYETASSAYNTQSTGSSKHEIYVNDCSYWRLAFRRTVQMEQGDTFHLDRGHTILTSRELMWCWDVRGDLTLNYMAQIHTSVTLLTSRDLARSSGRLTCQHASQISAVAHISWDVTYVSSVLQTYQLFPEMEEMLIEKVRQRTFLYHT
jgi:hypothetical protein